MRKLVGVYSQKTVQRCTLNAIVRFIFAWTEDGNVHTHALFSGLYWGHLIVLQVKNSAKAQECDLAAGPVVIA